MQNIFQNSYNQKDSKAQNLSPESPEFNKLSHILKNGKAIYLNADFNFEAFKSSIKIYLHNELKLKTNTENYNENFSAIQFNSPDSFAGKVNINIDFIILFLKINNVLYFDINLAENYTATENKQSNLNISSLLNDSHKKEITIFIYETIYKNYLQKNYGKKFDFDNIFIEETHLNERIFINSVIKDERLLVKLNLSSLKLKEQKDKSLIFNSSFIITEKSIAVFGFNKLGDCILFENIDEKFEIRKKITKNTIRYNDLIWQAKRSNSKLFSLLKNIHKHRENDRIREIARLNYFNKRYSSSINLISSIKEKEENPVNDFIIVLIRVKKDKNTVQNYISDNDFKEISHRILNFDNAEKSIINILNEWQISYTEKTFFLELFAETASSSEEQKTIIPLYETIRNDFKKQNKDLINKTVFDINYAEFLIHSGKKRKAGRILKNLLKHLPDETISDVLPAKNLDLLSNKSGQLLKIKILNLLTFAKGKSQSDEEIQKLVQLQPLNTDIISQLSESKNDTLRERATELRSLLRKSGLSVTSKEIPVQKYKALPVGLLNSKLRHPATVKNGSFYSFQKWISKIKADDYTTVKEYAEKIELSNHPKLYEIFENIQQIFNIDELEFYISRGEKSQGIIGYEGKPPFVIIGQKHLDKNSDLYLNFVELQFSVATELAHIYYKHSRISSNDVWRGVADKGSILLDALLGIVPVAGLAGKSIQNSQKLSRLTNIIKSSNQITNGKNIYDTALKLSNYYKSSTKTDHKTEKKQKLLAASRLMQYTADRVGLAVSGNIKSAIRAVFLTGKFNYAFFDEAEKTSLKELILKVNNDGSYKHQDLTLRIAHLFSFYISDVYSEIRDIITKKD